jgi:hypothetical protein
MIPGLKTADGALYVTTVAPAAGDPVSGGVTMTQEGWVRVNFNSPQRFDQGKAFTNNSALCVSNAAIAGYVNGLPVTATGALKCQLNQPVSPGDAYVGGLRVGPLGGLYIVDAAPAWTPANLFASGEQGAWYDPSDFSTMFQDNAGTTPVTAVGQSVGKILDKSGRNNHATQATAAGRPVLRQDANSKYYLEFDGVDDSLATAAINFTATDKMSVFSGVRKLTDTTTGMIVELGVGGTNGFSLYCPAIQAYQCISGGSVSVSLATPFTFAAPITSVLTQLANISGDSLKISVNTVLEGTNTADQGTGNYGNNNVYIGRRGGSSLPLNGRIYSLIVRGALSTTQEITDTETWVNGKTGAF